jgi:hypothetical protein
MELQLIDAKVGNNKIQLTMNCDGREIKYEALIDGGSAGPTCSVDGKPGLPGTKERELLDEAWSMIMKFNDDTLALFSEDEMGLPGEEDV